MFDGPLMLQVNRTIVKTIHSKSNKFVMGVKIKATCDLKLNGSPAPILICTPYCVDGRSQFAVVEYQNRCASCCIWRSGWSQR